MLVTEGAFMRQLIMSLGLFVFVTGCNVHLHPYKDYLNQSVGHTKHNAIAEKMGAPNRVVSLDKGGDVWTYEYCAVGGGVTGAMGSVPQSSNCQNVILVFDKSGKLIRWHDQDLTASPLGVDEEDLPAQRTREKALRQ